VPELIVAGSWRDRDVAVTTWCAGDTVGDMLRTSTDAAKTPR
jgi:hypothetical protein